MQILNLLKKANEWYDQPRFKNSQVFCTFIYLWVIIHSLTLLPYHNHFWGKLSWVQDFDNKNSSYFGIATNLLSIESIEPYSLVFIFLQILFCVLRILKKCPTLSATSVWFLTLNIDNKIFTTMDGGNNLIHIMLFYCIFMFPEGSNKYKTIDLIKKYSVNSSLFLARFQLCVVYFVAGHLKMTGEYWTNGMAFYYVFGVEEYSLPILDYLFKSFPVFSVLASYTTILFQISVPFLIWHREARPVLFFVGGLMHIGIAVGMGLFTFGLAMIVCYSAFYTPKQVEHYYILTEKFKIKYLIFWDYVRQKCIRLLPLEGFNEKNC